jgi:hypothetical protein
MRRCTVAEPLIRRGGLKELTVDFEIGFGEKERKKIMWNDEKQHRFDALRLKEAQGVLSDAQAQELQALFAELESDEAETLKEGMAKLDVRLDSLRAEKESIEAKNERLAAIVAEQEQLLVDAREYLGSLRRKQAEAG